MDVHGGNTGRAELISGPKSSQVSRSAGSNPTRPISESKARGQKSGFPERGGKTKRLEGEKAWDLASMEAMHVSSAI